MASLKSTSFDPVPPELVEDRWIDFSDGLETTLACSADAVDVAVPKDAVLPVKPGCNAASAPASPPATVGDKIKAWIKNAIH